MNLQTKGRLEKSLGPFFNPLYLFYLLVDDRKSWKYFPSWFWSFRLGQRLLGEAKPWIPFEAADWLRRYIQRNMKIFEYGSGGSTIFFAERAGQVFSVEHDKHWHALVSKALEQRGITNCSIQLHEPYSIVGTLSEVDSAESTRFIFDERESDYPRMSFDEYVRSIDVHPNHSFDIVLVDGRARMACIDRALPKIRTGGYMMLDNSNNSNVAKAVHRMQSYPRIDFHSIAPGWPPARWTTTAWQIPI